MDFLKFIMEHYIMLAELVGLWGMLDISVHLDVRTIRVTRCVILLILAEAILWSLEQWTQTFETLSIARPMLTATIYLIHPVILIGIMEMTEPFTKKWLWIFIPLGISAPLFYTSQWTQIVFSYSATNNYYGGVFKFYPYYLFGLYLALFTVRFIVFYSNYSRRTRRGIIYVIIASIVGVILHVTLASDTDYSTLFASIVILYYLFLYMHMSKVDTLTHMMNRQCFYYDSKHEFDRINGVTSIDMNELKWINDTKGHKAGDSALKAVAACINADIGAHKKTYRIGGDEFVVFYYGYSEKNIVTDIEIMKEKLSETPYTCAFGYSMKESGDTMKTLLGRADAEMYRNKAEIKKTLLESGQALHNRDGSSDVAPLYHT